MPQLLLEHVKLLSIKTPAAELEVLIQETVNKNKLIWRFIPINKLVLLCHMDILDDTDPCSGHIDPSKNGFGTMIC
jgi:hypothetical protein